MADLSAESVLERLSPETLGEVLRELGQSTAWEHYHLWLQEVRTEARAVLEDSSSWDRFLEARGILRALNTLLGFRDEVVSRMKEIEEEKENR